VVWRVILPAILPELLAGLRVGLSMTLLGTLIGEMFAAKAGVGQLLIRAIARIDSQTILALTLIMFVAALAMNGLLVIVERHSRGASPDFSN
jgi:NitT/TauT family transport system permease protein